MKIKIISTPEQAPSFEYGGQNTYGGLDLGSIYTNPTIFQTDPFDSVSKTLKAVPRAEANVEMEGGETVVRNMNDGSIAQFDINGAPHSSGGVPIDSKPGDFVFSKTKKMKIGGPILAMFGKPEDTKKKYSPADLAKQYDINKFQAILADPSSDKLQQKTAEMMIENYTKKLGGLAFVQEAKKGFPTGIPQLTQRGQQLAQKSQETPTAKFGGKMKYGGAPKYQLAGEVNLSGKSPFDPQIAAPDMYGQDVPTLPTQPIDPGFKFGTDLYSDNGNTNMAEMSKSFQQNPGGHSTPMNHPEDITNNLDNNSHIPFAYRNQDKLGMGLAAWQLANIKKYPGYVAPLQLTAAQYTLPDNSAEKAALASAANTQSMIGALSHDGSMQRANDSSIWGETLNRIQGSEAANRAQQIGISNQGAEKTADMQNKQAEFNSNRLTEMYKQGVISNQQYDNAIRAGQNSLLKATAQSMDNRQKLELVNRMNASSGHYIDPATQRIIFQPAYASAGASKNDPGSQLKAITENLIAANSDLNKNEAYKMAYHFMDQNKSRNTFNLMNPKQNKSTDSYSNYDNAQGYNAGPEYNYFD